MQYLEPTEGFHQIKFGKDTSSPTNTHGVSFRNPRRGKFQPELVHFVGTETTVVLNHQYLP